MRRRYGRRRAAKAKATATAAAVNASATGASTGLSAAALADVTAAPYASTAAKKRQTTVHAAAQIKLHVHGHEFQGGDEIVLNPDSFPQLREMVWKDYVVEVFHPEYTGETQVMATDGAAAAIAEGSPQNHLLLEIPESSAAPLKGKLQVSVLKDTATFFQLAPFKDVTVRFLPKTQVEVDFVEVALKDQFMSRRDLMYLKQSMVGLALYVGKTIRVQGTRWQVLDVRAGGDKVRSGVISETTKFTFRSQTSRVMWLVQISPEMWDMANSGMLYMEIFLAVVRNVLSKWVKHKASHSLTILFYSRCLYPEMDQDHELSSLDGHYRSSMPKRRQSWEQVGEKESSFPYDGSERFSVGVDENGRHYQDFYKLVTFDSIITDVQPLLMDLKKELNVFPRECGWRSPADCYVSSFTSSKSTQNEACPRPGVPSNARNGNLLEAVNLVLNLFEKHHIDRDLARSGQSVVLITAGNGIFSVNKRLSEITEQRMMDHGIGIDLLSLASRPLHKCPLFLFKESDLSEMKLPGRKDGNPATEVCLCSNNPHALKNAYQRRSRSDSNEVNADTQLGAIDPAVSSMRTGQLCKYCLQRMENCKNYIVPLWIPLWFVQENMLVPHECPLDEDITRFCDVCAPQSVKTKTFEPLPMCRMFKEIGSTHVDTWSLPKPLECLLAGFPATKPSVSDESRINTTINFRPSTSRYTHDSVIAAGLTSDLVRARASSITRSDDSLSYDGEVRTKARTFSVSEQNRLLHEYERYDDEAFDFTPAPKFVPKSSDSDVSVRAATPPPPRSGMPFFTSKSKKRTGVVGFQSGSAGTGNENGSNSSGGPRWRHYEQRSPSPLNVDMAEYRGSLEATAGSLDDDKDRQRMTSSSFPNTLQPGDGSSRSHTAFMTSPVLRPADYAVNEDIFHSQAYMLKQLTSNQRRWSQVRPYEDQQHKIAQNVLKWRSLCFPALLPLASDFMPAPKELQAHYTESFYSVMLPERDEQNGVMFRDYRELVLEMVAQRLSQDFQLVSVEVSNEAGEKTGTVFRLSMGHRIHEIVYNEETQTIDVKRYLQKVTTRSDVDIMAYRYLLWSPIVNRFVAVGQEFRKYLQIEYQWNHLDQLICGYIDDMSEGIRYKRSLYCLFPPRLEGSDISDQEKLRSYTEGCQKFLEFLRVKADASTGFLSVQFSTDWHNGIATSGIKAFKRVRQRSVKMLLHTNDALTSQNWVIAKIDTEVFPTQCFHVEIQWLVCRSSLVDDLITGLSRRAKQLGLEMHRVTENGISSNLDLHPLNCPIFLKIDDPFQQQEVEKALVERFGFCAEALHPIPFTHLNHSAEYAVIAQEARPPRARRMTSYYRQYVHRSMSCFARMTQTGLVWISNQTVHDDEIQPIFDDLRQYIESMQVARSALRSLLDDVVKPAQAAAPSMTTKKAVLLDRTAQAVGASVLCEESVKKQSESSSTSTSLSGSKEEQESARAETNAVVCQAALDTKGDLLTIAGEGGAGSGAPYVAEPRAADPPEFDVMPLLDLKAKRRRDSSDGGASLTSYGLAA